jgi:hypothetical protein
LREFAPFKQFKSSKSVGLQLKMAGNASTDDMMRRIIVNQRTIMEQNQKILRQQHRANEEERERGLLVRDKIPLDLKVCTPIFFFLLFS